METKFSAEYSSSNNLQLGFRAEGQRSRSDHHGWFPRTITTSKKEKKSMLISAFVTFHPTGWFHTPPRLISQTQHLCTPVANNTHIDCVLFFFFLYLYYFVNFILYRHPFCLRTLLWRFSSTCTLFLMDPFRKGLKDALVSVNGWGDSTSCRIYDTIFCYLYW